MSTPGPTGTPNTPTPPGPTGTAPTPGTTHLPTQGGAPGTPATPTGPATPSPQANQSPVPHMPGPSGPPPQLPPPTPPAVTSPVTAPGVIDVQPLQLYQVSSAVAFEQHSFHKALVQFLDAHAGYPRVGGSGAAAAEFAGTYAEVLGLLLELHAKAVVALGGAALGFTTTANNFGQADAATHPGAPPFVPRPAPQIIFLQPSYTPPPPFGVRDGNPVDEFLDVFHGIPGDLMREVVEEVLRTGRALEILPLPNYLRVNEVSTGLWLPYAAGIAAIEQQLTSTVQTITDRNKDDWHRAMLQFVSSLWGTTSWGQRTAGYEWNHQPPNMPAGSSLPVFSVLFTTAEQLAEALRLYAKAAQNVRAALRHELTEAFTKAMLVLDPTDIKGFFKDLFDRLKKLAKGLLLNVLVNIDTHAVNRAVDAYEQALRAERARLQGLIEPLREALREVPTFQAEEARAEAFGARSLFEFDRKLYPVNPEAWNPAHDFPVDLAATEWESNDFLPPGQTDPLKGREAHAVDRHIGLTPEQLVDRLRDSPKPSSASSFPDLPTAQQYVQAALDDPTMKDLLNNWMRRQEQKVQDGTFNPESRQSWRFEPKDANGQRVVTGSSVTRADYDAYGTRAWSAAVHSVRVVVAYSPESKTLYVVTAYPEAP
ncbi:RNase A-like domain-containing protein [Streptomyces sp. NPDC053493]|uniref:RNase A-like domain-containing protein n=1 Tax=Streptomyces sp. NPDC053493 TaxID=3365705 RepID=UPI0037D86640